MGERHVNRELSSRKSGRHARNNQCIRKVFSHVRLTSNLPPLNSGSPPVHGVMGGTSSLQ
jgi:hypothetical protein